MEIEDLKTIWQKYDRKLDHLEKLNKKLIMETLSKKPERKLEWIKFRTLYALIIPPVILVILSVVLQSQFKTENVDLSFVIGCFLTLAVILFLGYISFKSYTALRGIDLTKDSIIDSARKVNKYNDILNIRHKYTFVTYSLLFLGMILIIWKGLHFNVNTILFMIGLFVFSIVLGNKQYKALKEKVERLENEILELEEYEK